MAKKDGYVIIERSICDHWLWDDKPFSRGQAWIDLIMMANYKDGEVLKGNRIITFERGTVVTSIDTLAERWGWGRKKTAGFIKLLEKSEMVTKKGTTKGTTLTLVNYDKIQSRGSTEGLVKGTGEGTGEGTHYINNKIKRNKNNKEGSGPPQNPPTLEEVKEYAKQIDAASDPETFFRYYEERNWTRSRGLPIDDWHKTFDTWEARERSEGHKAWSRGDSKKTAGFTDFDQREYDFAELERKLMMS